MLETMMMGMAVESAMGSMTKVQELISAYKTRGIDVIPIKELEDAISKSMRESLSEGSLTHRVMKSMMKGERNGKK